jgi:hypothetical protein
VSVLDALGYHFDVVCAGPHANEKLSAAAGIPVLFVPGNAGSYKQVQLVTTANPKRTNSKLPTRSDSHASTRANFALRSSKDQRNRTLHSLFLHVRAHEQVIVSALTLWVLGAIHRVRAGPPL